MTAQQPDDLMVRAGAWIDVPPEQSDRSTMSEHTWLGCGVMRDLVHYVGQLERQLKNAVAGHAVAVPQDSRDSQPNEDTTEWYIGRHGISDATGRPMGTVNTWFHRRVPFPPPEIYLDGKPGWRLRTIEDWWADFQALPRSGRSRSPNRVSTNPFWEVEISDG